jgi:hypothetical protein
VQQAIYAMPMGKGLTEVVAAFSDFRPLSNGIRYAFRSEGTVDGKPAFASKLESVVVNGTIDEKLFVAPAAPAEMPGFPMPAPAGSPAPSPAP